MVALDDGAGDGKRLDAVGIDGALCEPARVGNFRCLAVEDLDEVGADNLALALGVCDACEVSEELVRSVDAAHVQAEALIVAEHFGEFVLAEHTVVHEDTGEVRAYGTVEQHGCHGGVHAAAEAEDDTVVAELSLEFGHGGLDERFGTPRARCAADAHGEVLKQLHAALAVEHLGVELHAPHTGIGLEGGELHLGSRGHAAPALGKGGDGVAVTHPHLCALGDVLEERTGMVDIGQACAAVLTRRRRLDGAAVAVRHELGAIADTQHRNCLIDFSDIDTVGVLVVHRQRTARENHTDDTVLGFTAEGILVVGDNLAVNIQLTHTTPDELGRLRAEIEDNNLLLHKK